MWHLDELLGGPRPADAPTAAPVTGPTDDGLAPSLAATMIGVARAALAGQILRDVADGFTRMPVEQVRGLQPLAAGLADQVAILCDGWPAAVADEPRLGALGAADLLLLAVAAAPALDRGVARSYRAGLDHDGVLTIGCVVDLVSPELEERLALCERLGPDAPLRRAGVVDVAGADEVAVSTPVAVAPWVLGLVRSTSLAPSGEPLIPA